jgi:glycerophosphoryl diester phosphodiesterase
VHRTEFIAHRGSSYLAPENTLAALRLGWSETTTCEVDVRATLDGRIVVIHDETTLRTTGLDLVVAQHSLAELQGLDAGAWKGAEWKGERLPSLAEVIAAMPPDKHLLIEIKGGPGIIPEVARVIRESGRAEELALQGFDRATCARARIELPGVPVYLLAFLEYERKAAQAAWDLATAIVREEKLDGLGVNPTSILDEGILEIQVAGAKLNIWTIDDPGVARAFVAAGVDGIITNRPGWLRARIFDQKQP